MRKLTIDGKPVTVWFERHDDLVMAIKEYCLDGYMWTKTWPPAYSMMQDGRNPLMEGDIVEMERFLKDGQPVLFCIHQRKDKYGVECNPLVNRLQGWIKQYPGLVAFGSRKTETWRIVQEHAEAFDLLGYS